MPKATAPPALPADQPDDGARDPPAGAPRGRAPLVPSSRATRRGAARVSEPGQRGDDAWEQTAWIWSALLYGVLAVATALALLDGQPRGRDRWVMLGLAALMAAWHLAFERLGIPRRSPVPV